jgi:hypothetical protein
MDHGNDGRSIETDLSLLVIDDEDGDEEGSKTFSDGEEDPVKPKAKKQADPKSKTKPSSQIDLTKLPVLDNSGLKYLPKMQYFPPGRPCPLQPMNSVQGEALFTLIHLPKGGFNCLAIPLEAVDRDEKK